MRIFEERTYTMYLNEEEFGLLFEVTKHIPYSYLYDTEENEYRIVMDEDMLDDCYELLKEKMYFFDMEGMRGSYEEMRDLVDSIYLELR
jgi:hypothetical protein